MQPDEKILVCVLVAALLVTTIVVVGLATGHDGVIAGSGVGSIGAGAGYLVRYYQERKESHNGRNNGR
jgi:hypothetical protein